LDGGKPVLEALGNIGDFLGGFGVVVTLIYLASQIRQNTRSTRMSAFQAAQRDIADAFDGLSHDPALLRVYFDGNRDFESFSKEDRRRYAAFMSGLLRRYETFLYHTRLGNIQRSHWEGPLAELRTAFKYPGTRAWWAKARTSFSADLRDFIEREILTEEPEPPGERRAAFVGPHGRESSSRSPSREWSAGHAAA
jgi:hypothetical protein